MSVHIKNILRFDSPVMVFLSHVADLIILSLLWLICSLPIITMGGATAAKRIAQKYNLPFVELQNKFDNACKQAPASYWLADGVHPTAMGHWLIKNEWMKAFQEMQA